MPLLAQDIGELIGDVSKKIFPNIPSNPAFFISLCFFASKISLLKYNTNTIITQRI